MSRPRLSINVNKYALLRNSRGRNVPNLVHAVDEVLAAGAHGITIHPRMDQRHIQFSDVSLLSRHLAEHHRGVELNIECEPTTFLIDLVLEHRVPQCTLVPVRPGEVTSDHGFTFPEDEAWLRPMVERLHAAGIRVSIFMDCEPSAMLGAAAIGVDRVELYTGPYAWAFGTATEAVERERVWATAAAAVRAGLEINAGHDLDRHNLGALAAVPGLREVSIGHAQICRALEVGTKQSVGELVAALNS